MAVTHSELHIGWCLTRKQFMASSIRCGLLTRGYSCGLPPQDNPKVTWIIQRDQAEPLCLELSKEGVELYWLGELPPPLPEG